MCFGFHFGAEAVKVERLNSPADEHSRLLLPAALLMNRPLTCYLLVACAITLFSALTASAQPVLSHSQPAAILPEGMTRLTLHGDKLTSPLRVWASAPVDITVVELQPQKAVLDISPAKGPLPLGTIGLLVATSEGVSAPLGLLVDSLPSIAESSDNHSPVTAQTIGSALAIDAAGDGKLFDYFRFHALAGQSLSFEALAQPFGSTFDAVVRILNERGEPLVTIDDDSLGPDCRFRHTFDTTGNYVIEVHDNKYAAGGRYRLRVGNFPIVNFAYPPFSVRGATADLQFGGLDGGLMLPQQVTLPADPWLDAISVTAMSKEGSSAAAVVRLSSVKQFNEAEPNNSVDQANAIDDAQGINGLLAVPGDRDVFKIPGKKDQTWRFAAKARSFGSPAMLKMHLKNSNGEVVAKTAVADADEWQFDVKFPADGDYLLECEDLLRRGGPDFAYHVDVGIAAPFTLALKPDAKTRDRLLLQPTSGAANIDLVVQRTWNNGPIELRFEPPVAGLSMINPVIPAGAKEHQLYLHTGAQWKPQDLSAVRLVGRALEAPEASAVASSMGLAVVRAPHVPYPNHWQDGLIVLAGVNDEPAFFEMTPPGDVIAMARPLADGAFAMTLKRVKPEFKEGVSLVKSELPPEWSAVTKLDKDTMTVAVKHPIVVQAEPQVLKFWWYGNLNGRGQLFASELKVRLFEPLLVTAGALPPVKRGQTQKLSLEVKREGGEPQPVVIKLNNLPAGVTGPESVTVAANETKSEITLTVAADAALGKAPNVVVQAMTKLGDKDVVAPSASIELEVIE